MLMWSNTTNWQAKGLIWLVRTIRPLESNKNSAVLNCSWPICLISQTIEKQDKFCIYNTGFFFMTCFTNMTYSNISVMFAASCFYRKDQVHVAWTHYTVEYWAEQWPVCHKRKSPLPQGEPGKVKQNKQRQWILHLTLVRWPKNHQYVYTQSTHLTWQYLV